MTPTFFIYFYELFVFLFKNFQTVTTRIWC